MLKSGDSLAERYRVERRLNQGGMGVVYLARDRRLGDRQVAVKEMDPRGAGIGGQELSRDAFRQEATLLARLHHPGLANVTDFFEHGGLQYLVMEYVAGETLSDRLSRLGRVDEVQTLKWARELSAVLAYLHRQQPPIVFRDLKPDNIMVQPDGTLKLIDFGIARFFKPGQRSDTVALGTVGYAAPEQYGRGQTDPRADVYSLGVVLHHLLTGYDPGRTPLNLPPLRELAPRVSPRLAAAIEQALALDPAQRFRDAAVFAQSLRPTEPALPPGRPERGGGRILFAAAVVVVLIAIVGVGYRLLANGPQRQADLPPVPPQQQVEAAAGDELQVAGEATTTEAAPTASAMPAASATASLTPEPPTATATSSVAAPTGTPAPAVDAALERAYLGAVAQPRSAVPVVYAYTVERPPVIDGNLQEWGQASYAIRSIVYGHEAWSGPDDHSGMLRVAWDANRLYLALEVTDDRFVQESAGQTLYRGDSAELWLDADLAGDFSDGAMNGDDTHIGVSPGHPESLFSQSYRWSPGAREGLINDEVAAAHRGNGYTLEWAIPWSQLSATAGDGAAFGFTFCLSDNDIEGVEEQESLVCLHGSRRHNDPPSWGTLILITR